MHPLVTKLIAALHNPTVQNAVATAFLGKHLSKAASQAVLHGRSSSENVQLRIIQEHMFEKVVEWVMAMHGMGAHFHFVVTGGKLALLATPS